MIINACLFDLKTREERIKKKVKHSNTTSTNKNFRKAEFFSTFNDTMHSFIEKWSNIFDLNMVNRKLKTYILIITDLLKTPFFKKILPKFFVFFTFVLLVAFVCLCCGSFVSHNCFGFIFHIAVLRLGLSCELYIFVSHRRNLRAL